MTFKIANPPIGTDFFGPSADQPYIVTRPHEAGPRGRLQEPGHPAAARRSSSTRSPASGRSRSRRRCRGHAPDATRLRRRPSRVQRPDVPVDTTPPVTRTPSRLETFTTVHRHPGRLRSRPSTRLRRTSNLRRPAHRLRHRRTRSSRRPRRRPDQRRRLAALPSSDVEPIRGFEAAGAVGIAVGVARCCWHALSFGDRLLGRTTEGEFRELTGRGIDCSAATVPLIGFAAIFLAVALLVPSQQREVRIESAACRRGAEAGGGDEETVADRHDSASTPHSQSRPQRRRWRPRRRPPGRVAARAAGRVAARRAPAGRTPARLRSPAAERRRCPVIRTPRRVSSSRAATAVPPARASPTPRSTCRSASAVSPTVWSTRSPRWPTGEDPRRVARGHQANRRRAWSSTSTSASSSTAARSSSTMFDGKGDPLKELTGGGQEGAQADALKVAQEIQAFAEIAAISLAVRRCPLGQAGGQHRRAVHVAGMDDRSAGRIRGASSSTARARSRACRRTTRPRWRASTADAGGRRPEGPATHGGHHRSRELAGTRSASTPASRPDHEGRQGRRPEAEREVQARPQRRCPPRPTREIRKLKDAGITTVVCGCDPLILTFLTAKAKEQNYTPGMGHHRRRARRQRPDRPDPGAGPVGPLVRSVVLRADPARSRAASATGPTSRCARTSRRSASTSSTTSSTCSPSASRVPGRT